MLHFLVALAYPSRFICLCEKHQLGFAIPQSLHTVTLSYTELLPPTFSSSF